jgi:predicted PurR-regulated permease PerM
VVSVFFAAAMIPAVQHLHEKRGWRPGAAVGVIYAALVFFVLAMVLLLIPAVADFAGEVADNGDDWIQDLNEWTEEELGVTAIDQSSASEAASKTGDALGGWTDKVLGLASSGLGVVFDLATIGLFTFYFAADNQRIRRALLSRMPPHRQRVYSWISDTALEQTGGYFYSRLLLMVINGTLFFAVMVAVGVPVSYALPLSLFEGFVAEFIPAVGTYIGAAVPILVTLGDQGLASALILLAWTLVYQQAENYWLSPRLSAKTMELNGGVAFGAALAGGAIAGPMGAFMALPVAALITATVSNIGRTYDVVYATKADATATADTATEPEGQS